MALCSLLNGSKKPVDPNPVGGSVMRLEENEKVARRNWCQSSLGSAFLYHTWEPIEAGFVDKVVSWGYPPPTAIYVNSGLHVLRGLGPAGQNWTKQRYQEFHEYETHIASAVDRFHASSPDAKAILMLSHCICESVFFGAWGQQVADFNQNPAKAAESCASGLRNEGVESASAQSACEDSFFLRSKIQGLNKRALEAIKRVKTRVPEVVDAFTLTDGQCQASNDRVHYNSLVLNELKLLFDALGF